MEPAGTLSVRPSSATESPKVLRRSRSSTAWPDGIAPAGPEDAAPSGPAAGPANSASTTADVSARGAASGGGTAAPGR